MEPATSITSRPSTAWQNVYRNPLVWIAAVFSAAMAGMMYERYGPVFAVLPTLLDSAVYIAPFVVAGNVLGWGIVLLLRTFRNFLSSEQLWWNRPEVRQFYAYLFKIVACAALGYLATALLGNVFGLGNLGFVIGIYITAALVWGVMLASGAKANQESAPTERGEAK